ncbi:MAG: GH116 family glycosyl-hydrolase [bacterium]
MSDLTKQSDCSGTGCCGGGMGRRGFLQKTGLGAASLLVSRLPVMAGPFEQGEFEKLVPADKKLDSDWVKSLFARGAPEVLRGKELRFIGMPVGGICAGQLYLGGDGKLWHWDIFNQPLATGSDHYAKPLRPSSTLEQKFSLTIGGKTRTFDKDGFTDISFRGEYPIGRVEYRAEDVAVTLEAFSPFIPLNTDDSSLPATVMQFAVKNTTSAPFEATLTGSLENAVARSVTCERRSRIIAGTNFTFLGHSAEKPKVSETSTQPDIVITFTDHDVTSGPFEKLPDNGTMGLALLGAAAEVANEGMIGRKLKLAAGESALVTFVLTWHFPNLVPTGVLSWDVKPLQALKERGRYYATRFPDAAAVARYCAAHFDRLASQTRLWRDTWYDSTLPYWFLDRTHLNSSILASSTCHRFATGRFWAWEGVGCCSGTCTHVWHYAHAMGRQFPELERILREKTDFGLALQPDGAIYFRGENNGGPAVDGQAGSILRALREHQMSADDAFLKRIWPGVKRATEWLIKKDGDGDGLIVSAQHNTLDSDWHGPVTWLSGLYLAALEAAAAMADEMGDAAFAKQCRDIAVCGQKNIVSQLFDGEYFINKPDPKYASAINSGRGCEIDQVMGQGWAWQVGLPRVFPVKETRSALRSLWKYNFTPDVGPYREVHKSGRWYAMAGEAGLLMCTFPRADESSANGGAKTKPVPFGYFNECMNGFEHQVAGHMLWEGMAKEGLAIIRAVHDRYHASRRNPYNEIECGDHYARSMASYGVFIAACGFEYHGPKGHIGFAPRLTPENFKAAFTSAEGWGTYEQNIVDSEFRSQTTLRCGTLRVKTIALAMVNDQRPRKARVSVNRKSVHCKLEITNGRAMITLSRDVVINAGESINVVLR